MPQKVKVTWDEFWSSIKLLRKKYSEEVIYEGTYNDHGVKYTASFPLSNEFFDGNKDNLEYIDWFAKEHIANDIYKQINQNRRS